MRRRKAGDTLFTQMLGAELLKSVNMTGVLSVGRAEDFVTHQTKLLGSSGGEFLSRFSVFQPFSKDSEVLKSLLESLCLPTFFLLSYPNFPRNEEIFFLVPFRND